mgnify:CR=1 FL=1
MERKEAGNWDTYTGEEGLDVPDSEDWEIYFGTEDW